MPCKIEIRKKIEKSVEQLTDPAIGLSLDLSNKKANEVNKLFDHTVVKFVISGDVIERDIFIPESLIQIYFDNELEMEKQAAARLLKEEEEKERKYVESKKEEWEENREYFESDEPFTRVSVNEKPIPDTGIQGTLFDKYSLSSNLSSIHDEALDNIIKDLSERFDIPIKKIYSDDSWMGRYTSNGEIELNTRTLKADTPFHEIAHPFIDLIEKQEIKLYDNLVKQIKAEKTILEEVQNNSYYKNLPENEQIKEAIVTAIGRYAAFNINPKTGKGLISVIKTLLQSISNYLKGLLKAEKIRLSGDWRNNDNIDEQKLGKLKTISANITLSDLGAFFALGKGKYSLKNFNNKLYNESRKYEGKHLDIINDVLSELKKKNTYDKGWGWEQNLADKLAQKYPKVFDIENDPYSAANLKNYRESEEAFMEGVGQKAEDTFQNLYDTALNELNYVKQLITYGSNKELLNLMFLKHPNITISTDNSNENIYNIYVMENKPSYIEEDKEYVFVDKYNKWISISKRYKTKTGGTSYNPVTSEDPNWEKVIAKFQKLDTEEFRPKLEQFIKNNILQRLQHSYILSHTKESYIEESLRNMQGMYGEQLQFSEYDIIGMANKKILENILFANNIITNSILGSSGIWSSLNAYHPFVQKLYQIKKKEFDKALLNDFTKRKEALKAILGFKKLQSELGLDVEEFESLSDEDENIAAPVPKWFLDMHSMASSGEYFDDIKMGLAKGITYLGAGQDWDKKMENPEYKTRAEQILESKDLTIFLRDYFYPDYTGSTFNDLKQQFKTKYSLDSNQEEPIKPGVEELFDSNPELANQVYEALGFVGNLNKLKVQDMKTKVSNIADTLENTKNNLLSEIQDSYIVDTHKEVMSRVVEGVFNISGSNPLIQDNLDTYDKYNPNKFEEYINYELGDRFNKKQLSNIISNNNAKLLERIFLQHKLSLLAFEEGKSGLPENLTELELSKITSQQKQQALQLYSQYLQQNPNGSVEQFKSWVEEFNNQKLKSNIQIFNPNNDSNFDSSKLKDDDLALMLFNKATNANVTKIEDIVFDDIQYDTSKKDFAFFGGFSRNRTPSFSEVLNQKGIYPENIMFIGESKIYPNFYEILENQNDIIENSVKSNFDKIFSFGFTSSVFDQIKKELNNSQANTFVFETADGQTFKFPKRFVKGFYNLTSHISKISEENRTENLDKKVKEIIKNKRETNDKGVKPVIVKEFYNDNSTDLLKYAIELIDNPIIQDAVKNASDIKVVVFSNKEFSPDNTAAWYQPNTNTIYVHESNLDVRNGAFQLMAHELVHGVTHLAINYDSLFKNEINALLNEVKKKTGLSYSVKDTNSIYGLKDEHEFLSEAFSNPAFKNLLESLNDTVNVKLTLWQKFINSLYNLFSKNPKYKESSYNINIKEKLDKIIQTNNFKFYNVSNVNDNSKYNSLSDFISQKSQERLNAIQEIFNQNPELSKIGDVFSYASYLNTIFPNSKVKDIVYHGTNKTFDTFKKQFDNGFFVTKNKDYGKIYGNNVKSILINSKNILNIYDLARTDKRDEDINLFIDFQDFIDENDNRGYSLKQLNDREESLNNKVISLTNRPFLYEFYKEKGYDSLLGSDEYVVFEPEQIHVLGSKQDIEGFKEFVGESTQTVESYRAQEQEELSQRIPNIENYKVDGKVDKSLITDENDLEIYNEIYDKYDALITPLLEASEESKEQTEVEKAVEELRKEVESIAPVNVPAVKVVEDEEGNIEPVDTKPAQKKISKKTYEDVLAKMKDIVKILGIKVEFTDLGPDIMAKADMFNRLIQFSDDTSSEHNFTEEVLHFVVDILEQKEPQIFNKLMSEIWKYSIYKDVKDTYSNEPKFQTAEGNPDIRLLKKEAVGQLLTAYVLDIEEIKDDKNFIGSIWDTISKVIKSLFYNIPFNKRSEFEELASDILNKNLITSEDAKYIGNSREEFYAKKGSKITSAILANKKKLGKKTDIEYNFADSKAMYDHFINLNISTTREISKEINPTTGLEEEAEYYISNGEKKQRVSSIISESNKELLKNISQDDVAKALREAKMQKGTEVHQVQEDIIRRFIDPATGLLRDTPEPRPVNYPFDVKFYNILEDNVEKRLKSYPVGTRFLVETKIINEEFGYGGTMDFLAILPNMDVELLDWKTTDVSYWEGGVKRNRFDIAPFNQSYWRSQLSLYSRALQENGVKNIKLARAIPIAVELKQKVLDNKKSKTDPANLYYELVNLNIGDINPKKIKTDEFYLIPVSVAQEVTGVKELDEILDKLIGLKDRVQGTRYKETELYKKKLELDRINSAIREIQGKQQITIFSTLFNENFKRYKTLSTKEFDFLDSLEKGQKFLSKAQEEELHAYFNDAYSAIEFLDTFKNINALVVSLSENGLLEEYTDQVKQNILKLSANAGAIKNLIEDRSTEIVDKLAIVYDIENFSSADIVGSYGITNFVSILHRTEKSIALTGRILNVIKYLEAEEKKRYFDRENGEFAKTFKGVLQWAKKNKSSMKNAYSKLFDKEKEKLISKYSDKFKEELEAKNEEFSKILEELKQNAVAMGYKGADYTNKINEYFDYTKQWLEDSFDLKKYEEDFIKAFNSQKEWIDKQTWNEDFLLNEEFKSKKIREWVENHNIFTSPKALSSSNFLLYDSMKDKWLSDGYKELQKDSNKELLAAYNLFISLNERARKSGMLDNMYSYRTFKPLIYEPTLGKATLTAIQKLGLEGWYALKYISDFIKKRIGFVLDDNVYDTNYDPLTKRAIKKIPVRFKQVDEKNMDYVSDDLFSLYQRWASHIINYELLSNFENRFKMIQLIESNRSSELAIDSKGNLSKEKDVNGMTIKNKNKVVAKDRNNQTDIDLNKYINNYLYSTNLDAKPEYYKLGISLMDYAQSLFLNLNLSSPILNIVGGSILSRLNQGNWFSKNDLTSIALPLVLGIINKKLSPFGDDLIGKASYLITEFNTNITSEYDSPDLNFYKTKGKQSAKKLLNAPLTIGDHLMQNALSIAVFLNTAVIDGELVNINDYVGAKYLPTVYNTQLSYKERNKASNKMKDEINKMKKTKSLLAITKKNGKSYSIEGFNSSQTTYDLNKLNYGNTIHSFIKQSIGNYDEYDKSLVNINFYFRFVMQMKKWMPRVIGSALNEFEENYELGGGSYGRKRIFFKTLFQAPLVFLQATASSLLQQLPYLNSPNKSFIDYAKEVYKQKQIESRDKGKELKTTEAEFVKLYTEGFKNQINELTIIATTLYALSLIAAAVADDPDKWYWKFIAKLAFKLKRELTFSYDPEQATSLLQNNLFPALGAFTSLYSAIIETGKEGKGHIQKLIPGYEEIGQENIDAAKPLSKIIRAIPVGRELDYWMSVLDPELPFIHESYLDFMGTEAPKSSF